MICPITFLQNTEPAPCRQTGCAIWDAEHDRCSILSYLTATQTLNRLLVKVNQRLEDAQDDD